MTKHEINERIAIGLFGFQKTNKCIDGKKISYLDKYGAPYFEGESCFPDYMSNFSLCCEILTKFDIFEFTKYTNSIYTLRARQHNQQTAFELTAKDAPEVICKIALKVFAL